MGYQNRPRVVSGPNASWGGPLIECEVSQGKLVPIAKKTGNGITPRFPQSKPGWRDDSIVLDSSLCANSLGFPGRAGAFSRGNVPTVRSIDHVTQIAEEV